MNKLFVISGPSGSGKGTLVSKLLNTFPDLQLSISATTRPKRPGETENVDYYFLSEKEFDQNIKSGRFLETEEVHHNRYGTLKNEVDNKLKKGSVIFELDTKGANTVKKLYGNQSILIFINVTDISELRKRLIERRTDNLEIIEKRVEQAKEEIGEASTFDYIINNDTINVAFNELITIVQKEIK